MWTREALFQPEAERVFCWPERALFQPEMSLCWPKRALLQSTVKMGPLWPKRAICQCGKACAALRGFLVSLCGPWIGLS